MNSNDTTNANLNSELSEPAAWIGVDWGDTTHHFVLQERGASPQTGTLEHSSEHLHRWLKELEKRFGGRPGRLGIETSRGAVIAALLLYAWLEIYPINPVTSARYRHAFTPCGAKDDQPDALLCLELVRDHAAKLRPLRPQDPQTAKLAGLVQTRRDIVDRRTTSGLADDSLLVEMVASQEMPKRGPKLTPPQVQLIVDWINQGALDN